MNYKKVIEDSKKGKLKGIVLCIDNDGGYWAPPIDDEEKCEIECERLEKKYGSPGGYSDVVEILRAAGVNAEWV